EQRHCRQTKSPAGRQPSVVYHASSLTVRKSPVSGRISFLSRIPGSVGRLPSLTLPIGQKQAARLRVFIGGQGRQGRHPVYGERQGAPLGLDSAGQQKRAVSV